jgi:hypothetical protein
MIIRLNGTCECSVSPKSSRRCRYQSIDESRSSLSSITNTNSSFYATSFPGVAIDQAS